MAMITYVGGSRPGEQFQSSDGTMKYCPYGQSITVTTPDLNILTQTSDWEAADAEAEEYVPAPLPGPYEKVRYDTTDTGSLVDVNGNQLPVVNTADLGAEVIYVNKIAGADPTGVADSTAAFATAITQAAAVDGWAIVSATNSEYLVDKIEIDLIDKVVLDFRGSIIRKRIDSGLGLLRTPGGSTRDYGRTSNVIVIGGDFDPNGKTASYVVDFSHIDGIQLHDVTVIQNRAVSGAARWGICLGGRRGVVRGCRVLSGSAVFEDGIHLQHGTDWLISDCYVEAGDDAIVLGGEPTDLRLTVHPEAIRRVTVSNCVVKAQRAYGVSVYVMAGATGTDWELSDVEVTNVVGRAGMLRNGGVRVVDLNDTASGTSQIKRVRMRGINLAVGSTSHDDTGSPTGVSIKSATDVDIQATIQITEDPAAATGFYAAEVTKSQDVSLALTCPALGKRFGVAVTATDGFVLKDSKLTRGTGQAHLYLSDVRRIDVDRTQFLNIDSAGIAVNVSSLFGKRTAGRIRGCRFQATSGGSAFSVPLTTLQHVAIEDCDFSGVGATGIDATIRVGQSTTAAAGYDGAATSFQVVDSSVFQDGDSVLNIRSREKYRVAGAPPDATHVTVVRARQDTLATLVTSGDVLAVQRVTIRGSRGVTDLPTRFEADGDRAQAGAYAPNGSNVISTVDVTAASNIGGLSRFVPDRDMVVTKVAFMVGTAAGSDDAVDVAIYDGNLSRLVSSGATTGKLNGSAGVKTVSITSTILRAHHVYYIGLSIGTVGGTAAVIKGATFGALAAAQLHGSSAPQVELDRATSVHPLPSTWTLGAASGNAFLLAVREQ